MKRYKWLVFGLVLIVMGANAATVSAQSFHSQTSELRSPSPGRALLYSLIVPGLGHYYIDHHHWGRGQVHLAAEAILWTALIGLNGYSNSLHNDMFTYAAEHSGTDIRNRDRRFQLAVGDFNSLQDYNDYQARARNWNEIYANGQKYYWQWDQQNSRLTYQNMNNRYDKVHQQIPAVIALMVANRVISGISAYIQVRHLKEQRVEMGLAPVTTQSGGVVAQVRIGF